MSIRPTRIFPLGDSALTVEFGNEISVKLNAAAINLANYFAANPFPGFVEAVPAIASTTIFYKPGEMKMAVDHNTAFAAVKDLVLDAVRHISPNEQRIGRQVSIPVSFLTKDAPDLESVAAFGGLKADEVVDIFLSREYRVFMLGFLPGFPYMGVVDGRIAAPRHATPRVSVPKGSVGIAGFQTGIYPSNSPGGWRIIGRTDLELFDPESDPPSLFAPGDRVRFVRK